MREHTTDVTSYAGVAAVTSVTRRLPCRSWLDRRVVITLGLVMSAGVGVGQQPDGPPKAQPAGTTAEAAWLQDYLQTTRLQIRDVPWQGHPLALLIEWAPERKPKPIMLPTMPAAAGALREHRITFPSSPGGALVETATKASGRPAVALVGDLLPNGTDLHRAQVADAAVLAAHPGYLHYLRCDGGEIATLAAELPRFTALRKLQLGPLLDDRVAAALVSATWLEELVAGDAGLTDAGLFALGQLPSLKKLMLYGDLSQLRGQTLPTLHRLQSLRLAGPLDPGSGQLTGDRRLVHEIVRLSELQELQFVMSRLPGNSRECRELLIEPLVALPDLRRLCIVLLEGSLSPFVEHLARLPLTHLRLSCENLTAEDAALLAGMRSLRELDLSDVQFDDPAAVTESLATMTGLQRLGLAHVNVSGEQRRRIVAALGGCLVESASHIAPGGWVLSGETAERPGKR